MTVCTYVKYLSDFYFSPSYFTMLKCRPVIKLSLSTGGELFVGRVENAAKKATAIDEGKESKGGAGEMSPFPAFPLSGKA